MLKDVIKTKIFENYKKENSLSKTKFCKICGIGVDTFNRIVSRQNFRLKAILRLQK